MKKFLSGLFFAVILLFFVFIGNVQANTFNSIQMDIYIDKNGDAHITEIWDYTATDGTERQNRCAGFGTGPASSGLVGLHPGHR